MGARFDAGFAFLTFLLGFVGSSLQQGQIDNINAYENFTIASVGRFIEANVGHAQITDILPNGVAPNIQPPDARPYKLVRCKRVDVTKCVRAGNSSNGLPYYLLGAYWQEGITWDEELSTPQGPFDQKEKRLQIDLYKPRAWGVHDTGSVKAPGQWYFLPSGAAHMNIITTYRASINAFFNEDLTYARITAGGLALGFIKVAIPDFLFDWTMTRLPDDSWDRRSGVLGIPTPEGNYILRQVVTGDLQRGKYFDQWVKSRGGRDFLYLDYY